MYLVRWLGAEGLTEGLDYQIMFFGGSLGAHVTVRQVTDPGEQLAAIRLLSRRCAVLVDSDRDVRRAKLKPHVQRFKEELEGDPHALLHITDGRDIEKGRRRSRTNIVWRTGPGAGSSPTESAPRQYPACGRWSHSACFGFSWN
jgi:hypothetical protein